MALLMFSSGRRVTLVEALALIRLVKLPRFWASVKTIAALFTSGVGSPAWMARVSVNVNDEPGAMLPHPAAIASASRLPSKVSVNELLGLLVSSTRFGLSVELVLLTV